MPLQTLFFEAASVVKRTICHQLAHTVRSITSAGRQVDDGRAGLPYSINQGVLAKVNTRIWQLKLSKGNQRPSRASCASMPPFRWK